MIIWKETKREIKTKADEEEGMMTGMEKWTGYKNT